MRLKLLFVATWLLAGALRLSAGPAILLDQVLPFADTDRVRVDVVLTATEVAEKLDLYGFISHQESGTVLWQGTLGRTNLQPGQKAVMSATVSGLRPELWTPENPALYGLRVSALRGGRTVGETKVRFGFRSMKVEGGQFYLNGKPVFLRGVAINPPGRTIPTNIGESRIFAEKYVRHLKSRNVNIFRVSTDASQAWFDVCDEVGMMLYAGRYGTPPFSDQGKLAAPKDSKRSIAGYQRLFQEYVRHPSIVMYYLANELPVSGQRGEQYSAFLTEAHAAMRQWDPTRPYIANAGYGEGREGDVCDVHRYWGWYYNSFLTYYNLRDSFRAEPLFGLPEKNQPITFTECVGAFTSSQGEFNLVRSKQLAPRLGWIGHTEDPRQDSIDYQCFLLKQATESFRRMRPMNTRLAGIMPFTILFDNWNGIVAFDQMKPKPALAQLAISYQPVLLSWELWTPQVYAGAEIRPIVHIVNDADSGKPLKEARIEYTLKTLSGSVIHSAVETLPEIGYYQTWNKPVVLEIPRKTVSGDYVLCGAILGGKDGMQVISTNWTDLLIAGEEWRGETRRPEGAVALFDPAGSTAKAFDRNRVSFRRIGKLNAATIKGLKGNLVIGENAWTETAQAEASQLRTFVENGGRVLILQQTNGFDTAWLPASVEFLKGSPNDTDYPPRTRPFREQMNVNLERPDHAVFRGLDRRKVRLWSDYTDWNQARPGFPKIYPVTSGFKLAEPADLAHTAILADYDRGLEAIALAEFFLGAGSVTVCGFDLVNRAGLDPASDRLLGNLAAYTTDTEPRQAHPLVDQPIRWGDFVSEKGTICGSLNGLLVNAEWTRPSTNQKAPELADNTGAWNMMPGDQFVPRGRNPFGAYSYSTASGLRDQKPAETTGTGFFWVSLPEGRRNLLTVLKNPGTNSALFRVAVDLSEPAASDANCQEVEIPAGRTFQVRTALPAGAQTICVRYTGPKQLVLLETSFE